MFVWCLRPLSTDVTIVLLVMVMIINDTISSITDDDSDKLRKDDAVESSVIQNWLPYVDDGKNNDMGNNSDGDDITSWLLYRISCNQVQQRLLMCCLIDSVWSRCTPRYLTELWKGMLLPPITAYSQPTRLIRKVEPTSMISVFSVFSLLLCIQDRASLMQVWMFDWAEAKSQGGALSDRSVSSAYLW